MPQLGLQWSRRESDLSLAFSPYRLVQIMVLVQPCSEGPALGSPSLALSYLSVRPLDAPTWSHDLPPLIPSPGLSSCVRNPRRHPLVQLQAGPGPEEPLGW